MHVDRGFTLFTGSEVRLMCCDYVMHYSREEVRMSETQKSKVRAKFMPCKHSPIVEVEI